MGDEANAARASSTGSGASPSKNLAIAICRIISLRLLDPNAIQKLPAPERSTLIFGAAV